MAMITVTVEVAKVLWLKIDDEASVIFSLAKRQKG